jgi:hypothetical protein
MTISVYDGGSPIHVGCSPDNLAALFTLKDNAGDTSAGIICAGMKAFTGQGGSDQFRDFLLGFFQFLSRCHPMRTLEAI